MVLTVGTIRMGECAGFSVEVSWEIDGFQQQLREWGTLESDTFSFGGHMWSLSLLPAKTMHAQNILQSLSRLDEEGTSYDVPFGVVQWSAGIVHADGQSHHTGCGEVRVDAACRQWKTVAVWLGPAYSDLYGEQKELILPGGRLTVAVQLSADPTTTEPPGLATLSKNLKDLYQSGKECDVTLKVRNKMFRAHRLILGARSMVLAAMFSHNMTEAESGVVIVEDCNPDAFEVFLSYLYSGTAENLTGENVVQVYYVADKYDLHGLRQDCVRFMLSTMATHSVCAVLDLAARHGEGVLLERATAFFLKNAQDVFRTAAWSKLVVENTTLADELLHRSRGESLAPKPDG